MEKEEEEEGQEFRSLEVRCKLIALKKNWVSVFSFMYLVSVDPMDRSKVSKISLVFLKTIFF